MSYRCLQIRETIPRKPFHTNFYLFKSLRYSKLTFVDFIKFDQSGRTTDKYNCEMELPNTVAKYKTHRSDTKWYSVLLKLPLF